MRKNVLIKTVYNCQSDWITNSRKPNPEKKTRYLKCFLTGLNLINRSVCNIQRNLTISNFTSTFKTWQYGSLKPKNDWKVLFFFKKIHIAGRNVKIEGLKGKFKHFQDLTRNLWRTNNKFKNTRNNFSCWGIQVYHQKVFIHPFYPNLIYFTLKSLTFSHTINYT